MNNTIWDISNEDFIEYVSSSNTYSDILRKCGYTNLGNTKTIKKRIKLLNLSTEHFIKYKLPKKDKIPIENIFIENSTYNNNTCIKKILYDKFNWEYKCNDCGINEYNNKPISLELDHINGNNTDNRIDNLRLLCPNCHSQTPTFRYKNKPKVPDRICIDCNTKIYNKNKSGYCKNCIGKYRLSITKNKPSLIILENDLKELKTYVAVGKKYNVSDNCIRKWIRNYNKEIINNIDLDKLSI
jgi:Zn finger protein HypA/HybF involved in hydrogenase expression